MSPNAVLISTIGEILSGRVKIAALSLRDLISSLSPHNKNSLNCTTALLPKVGSGEDENLYRYKVVCSDSNSDPTGHIVEIQLQDDPTTVKDKKNLKVKVNCDCPAFLYHGGQYNLHQKDTLLGEPRGKLAPPRTRDPVQVNMGCKHVFAVVRKMLDKLRFTKPEKVAPLKKVKPEDEEFLEKPGPSGPFEKKKPLDIRVPNQDKIVFERKTVPDTLLPTDVDTQAVEAMEEQVIPRIPGVPRLFKKESPEGEAFSTFRPVKTQTPDQGTDIAEEGTEEPESDKPQLPSSPPRYQLTPKHFDDKEDLDDVEEAKGKRDFNRLNRKKKLQSILGVEEEEVEKASK